MSLQLFSNALTGNAAIASVTDDAVQTTKVFANSDFGRWTHIVKVEPDLSDVFERKEKLFLYNQNRRDGAIGRLGETGFVADETFAPGSFESWSHIVAVGSLLFFYNQMTGEGAVATTKPQRPEIGALPEHLKPNIPQHLGYPGKSIPANQTQQPSTSEYFVTVSTYAAGSLGNWSHVAASGSYLLFYNQGDGSGRISTLTHEPLTGIKDFALGAKVSLRSVKDLGKGSIGHWTHVVGAKPYLLFYNEGSGAGQVAKVSDVGLNVVLKLAEGSFGRWTHVTVGAELIKMTKNYKGLGIVEANGAAILFYDAGSGAGALGQLSDDSFKTVKTFGPGEFGRWTSISNTTVTAYPLAQLLAKYKQIGAHLSPLGLPTDPRMPVFNTGQTFRLDFRGGQIEVPTVGGDPSATKQLRAKIWWKGIECQIRQEKTDEVYGGIGLIVPGSGLSKTHKFPDNGDGTWDMGPSGMRMMKHAVLLYDGPPMDIVLTASLIEHDSGDTSEVKKKIAEAIAAAALAAAGAGAGLPAEATAATPEWVNDLSLGLVNSVASLFGVDDDPYPPQQLLIKWTELQGRKFHLQTAKRDDDERTIEYTHSITLSAEDEGGSKGKYVAYFMVIMESIAELV